MFPALQAKAQLHKNDMGFFLLYHLKLHSGIRKQQNGHVATCFNKQLRDVAGEM